ncbi:MAG: outer membrane beta-barrel protein [Bacteroidetes bacterium]|nr:outer membrane beta-barrel protein [Bacteroidota bacterium]
MHDPKFEKEVQQKMAELEFGPSESVWANVEAAINGRRRRRLGMFWRFALPGLLLVAGGAYYFLRETPSKTAATAVAPRPAQNSVISNTDKTSSSTDNSTLGLNKIEPNAINATGTSTATNNATAADHSTARGNSTNSAAAGRPREGWAVAATRARREAWASRTHSPVPFTAAEQNVTDGNMTAHNVTVENVTGKNVIDRNANRIEDRAQRNFAFNPTLASLRSGLSPVRAGKLGSKTATSTVQTLPKPHNPWEAGFAGGAGLSSLHQMKLANYSLMQSDLPASLTAANAITTYAARPTKEYVSTVDPGPAFWFGIVAQKRLGPRWNFSVGLDFHYYSNRLHVGQQVSGYTPSSATYLNAQAVAPIQSYPYYSRGDDQSYMNRYYFLELPVAIEWKINRSHLLPMYLDGGISASYLVGSSAVYYNTHSGVYFKDAGVANRAQFNLNTALMVGLPLQKIRVRVGPQIQYGLTPLLNTDVSGPQHIFYGGIRLVVMPGKK